MRAHTLLSACAVLVATGCATGITLTDRGAEVHDVSPTEVPAGCEMLGGIAIGIPPNAARPRTEEELVTLMRNEAGQMGATHVMVESQEPRGTGAELHYAGRARAYRCPEDAPPVVPMPDTDEPEEPIEAPPETP